MADLKIRAQAAPWSNGIHLLICQGSSVGVSVQMQEAPEAVVVSPTLTISNSEAQVLMDDLWHAGLRPTEGTGSAGSLAATERHLKDMQKIVFGTLTLKKEPV